MPQLPNGDSGRAPPRGADGQDPPSAGQAGGFQAQSLFRATRGPGGQSLAALPDGQVGALAHRRGPFALAMGRRKACAEARFDGCYILSTDVPPEQMAKVEVVAAY